MSCADDNLIFDSRGIPPLALGLRSLADRTRHLLFSAAGRDIDLRITPIAERFALAGQVRGPEEIGMVELVNRSAAESAFDEAHVTSLDGSGEFRFAGLRPGRFSLTLRLGSHRVTLPTLDLGDQRS